MAKFEEDKIINALHLEKAEIGKEYYFSDNILNLKEDVENGGIHSELKYVTKTSTYPFTFTDNSWSFIYPCEEPPKQRMTNIQLMEWISKGNGIFKYKDVCHTSKLIAEKDLNNEVDKDIVIRTWDNKEWIEPTVDIYERDCKGGKE